MWITNTGREPNPNELDALAQRQAGRVGITVRAARQMLKDMLNGQRGGRPREEHRLELVHSLYRDALAKGRGRYWPDIARQVEITEEMASGSLDPESLRVWYSRSVKYQPRVTRRLVSVTPHPQLWKVDEDKILRDLWPDIKRLTEELPLRTLGAIRVHAQRVGLRLSGAPIILVQRRLLVWASIEWRRWSEFLEERELAKWAAPLARKRLVNEELIEVMQRPGSRALYVRRTNP
jgi:hypothetical protein